MSYQIYYDRAYIRVGDKFIPLVNSGSNNCFEVGRRGRERCEKYWSVQNWQREGQFIFSDSEIREIAQVYDRYNQESGMMFKSRNRVFGPGEMERWLINGMNNAYTIEEYVSFSNGFYVLDYSPDEMSEWKRHPFTTTDGLLALLDELKDSKSLEIKLNYNRDVYRPKANRARGKKLRAGDLSEYYVLQGELKGKTIYFVELTRCGGIRYYSDSPKYSVKVFRTDKEALRYLTKYHDRLKAYNFTPERVVKAA